MGITYIQGSVWNPKRRDGRARVRFLVDSGALYSVLPVNVSKRLKIPPLRKMEFVLADGTVIKRRVGEATFGIAGHQATSPVILGEKNDSPLLGSVTLETLGLMLNPLTREIMPIKLIPMKLILAVLKGKT